MSVARAIVAVLCGLLSTTAVAGGRLPCPEARVFEGAAVSLLVLPYRYTGNRYGNQDSSGSRLASLIQQEALFGMLKYGSVGATELVWQHGDGCDPRAVIDRVLSGSGPGKVRPGHGLVVMWGRIYEEGSQLYVQSYLRFLRRGRAETFEVALAGTAGTPLALTAELPAQAVAFAPRRLTQGDLAAIEKRARSALLLHDDNRRPIGPLAKSDAEPLAYGVIDARDGWMKIRSIITGQTGWVPARVDTEAWSLRRFLPELWYLDAVIGYLRLRTGDVVPPTSNLRAQFEAVERGLGEYDKAIGVDAAPEAASLGRAMLGTLVWTTPGLRPPAQARSEAARLCEEARKLLPESAGARALAAVTSPYLSPEPAASRATLEQINDGLLDALAVNAKHAGALRNLERLYSYSARAQQASPYEDAELTRRLQIVRGALE
jgi:hypothetical protein